MFEVGKGGGETGGIGIDWVSAGAGVGFQPLVGVDTAGFWGTAGQALGSDGDIGVPVAMSDVPATGTAEGCWPVGLGVGGNQVGVAPLVGGGFWLAWALAAFISLLEMEGAKFWLLLLLVLLSMGRKTVEKLMLSLTKYPSGCQ